MEDAYLAQYRMRRLTGTPYKTGTAPIWAPVKIAAKVSGNWQTRQVPVLQRTYLQLAEPILPGGSGIARLSQTLPSVLAAKTSRGLKKAPTDTFATIGADQPGMGMTNRACPLREKSGERFHAQNIRWGCDPKVPAPRIDYIGISFGEVLRKVPIFVGKCRHRAPQQSN